ncbi:6-phospho-3-hexuloisomerase [Methanoplanus sp. FWC-SCC4]|uniref:6-phospho-3-hexuloisomerase n=1 Tax=Methanochimaera problematica TaxID=2609417 RepID=A0AA97FEX1_9EURY|nr:6-phospho-3-hexuloisomerase [Methanoplanus sp. FWC-SCC4]WOF17028.1 6-phospho-3-hexuloisomerase [Methanoplanus sp. FWC-SCC4]
MTGCRNRDVKDNMRVMVSEISSVIDAISQERIDCMVGELIKERRIYVAGAGRSGLIGRAFAMRLMHIGLDSYVVGETVTPAMRKDDLVVIFSGSGETNSVVDIAETSKSLGGCLCLITSHKESRISELADCVVVLPSVPPSDSEWPNTFEVRQLTGGYKSLALPLSPIGTLFETSAMIFSDAVIGAVMDIKKCEISDVMGRLSNIQ